MKVALPFHSITETAFGLPVDVFDLAHIMISGFF